MNALFIAIDIALSANMYIYILIPLFLCHIYIIIESQGT